MGEVGTPFLAAALRRKGIRAIAYPPSGESELKSGRGNTSCKECLPLILTTGTLLNYVKNRKEKDEILVYFMATGSGPCRFGQYSVYLEELVKRLKLRDVAVMSLTSENTYVDLGTDIQRRAWWAILLSDLMEDLRSALLANARDADTALNLFRQACEGIESCLEAGNFRNLTYFLKATMDKLVEIPAKRPWKQVPGILLSGEIFVRRDPLSRRYLTDRLAEKGFAVICSPVIEWMYYCNFLVENNLSVPPPTLGERVSTRLKQWYMNRTEKQVKAIFSRAGQCHTEPIRTHQLIRNASNHISPHLTGEAILTIGSSLSEVGLNACGVIAIGPFGCMPNRLSEAILRENMKRQVILSKHPADSPLHSILRETEDLPFLAIETDGSPFPQLIQSKLEAFLLQAERLHGEMIKASR
jgi:predicted nucleotide-binding protein (sugar kinase/HSP70/actin superfamily)